MAPAFLENSGPGIMCYECRPKRSLVPGRVLFQPTKCRDGFPLFCSGIVGASHGNNCWQACPEWQYIRLSKPEGWKIYNCAVLILVIPLIPIMGRKMT